MHGRAEPGSFSLSVADASVGHASPASSVSEAQPLRFGPSCGALRMPPAWVATPCLLYTSPSPRDRSLS
eukprot:7398219-Pyramimonas_sp.AAC.1